MSGDVEHGQRFVSCSRVAPTAAFVFAFLARTDTVLDISLLRASSLLGKQARHKLCDKIRIAEGIERTRKKCEKAGGWRTSHSTL